MLEISKMLVFSNIGIKNFVNNIISNKAFSSDT